MSETNGNLEKEIKTLNRNLRELMGRNQYMIYSASGWKFAAFNFLGGLFRALGTFVGTIIVAAVAFYILGLLGIEDLIQGWLDELTMRFSQAPGN